MKQYIFILLLLSAVGCDKTLLGDEDQLIGLEENLSVPPALNDDWEVSTLAAQNIDAEPIHNLIRSIQKDPRNIHSLLIFRNNTLVFESYFCGWFRDRLHASRSASKSFISTLVGIAIDQGHISNVNQKLFDYFPEYADLNNAQKSTIEIKHLLTMTAGFQWDETSFPSDNPKNDETAFEKSSDRLGYILGKAVVNKPGDRFEYNSGYPVLEAAIVEKSTGEGADVFAQKNFFTPLNITNYYWRKNADGLITAVGPILLRPRDMAKLGQLFLDSGKWKGKQVVSAGWATDATATFIGNEGSATGYGYHWWTANYTINGSVIRIFRAQGSGGQYIFVVPSLNAVVVFTGGNYPPLNQGHPFSMMTRVILPAML
jgi:CubicO group peptidase (beta-lactamase class C family)